MAMVGYPESNRDSVYGAKVTSCDVVKDANRCSASIDAAWFSAENDAQQSSSTTHA